LENVTAARLAAARLYGILDLGMVAGDAAMRAARLMIAGGVGILQLRAKDHAPESLLPLARELARLCRDSAVPFIVNDHPSLARDAGADGVHVGQDDLPVRKARELAGAGAIVGKSTHSPDQARAAAAEGPDYIGYGPIFATPTKPDYTPVGTDDLAAVHADAGNLPVFCIGGIKLENLERLAACGARRFVIVSGILSAPDIGALCRACRDVIERTPPPPGPMPHARHRGSGVR
jgi:thiamine-phosphate pyrophosphorylase